MESTPPRQRHRRTERYQEESAASPSVVSRAQTETPYARSAPVSQTNVRTSAPTVGSRQNTVPSSGYGASPVPRALQRAAHMEQLYPDSFSTSARTAAQPSVPSGRRMEASPLRYVAPSSPAPQQRTQAALPSGRRSDDEQALNRYTRPPEAGEEEAAEEEAQENSSRLPGYMSASIVLLMLLILSLLAAQYLMMAYLKTENDKREAAYHAMLDNYHVLAGNDGTLTVTYQDYIEYYSEEYNLQPAFVTAIIRNESSFRRDAESSVGARGLMQMMPDTAEWIAGKLKVTDYSFDQMYDPETNIRFGCWYLGYLSRLFRGDPTLVAAAYHTGQTTVTRWLSDRSMSKDGLTIALEDMMDGPTKTYTGRVTQAYGIYHSLLYPDQPLHGATYAVPAAHGASGAIAASGR